MIIFYYEMREREEGDDWRIMWRNLERRLRIYVESLGEKRMDRHNPNVEWCEGEFKMEEMEGERWIRLPSLYHIPKMSESIRWEEEEKKWDGEWGVPIVEEEIVYMRMIPGKKGGQSREFSITEFCLENRRSGSEWTKSIGTRPEKETETEILVGSILRKEWGMAARLVSSRGVWAAVIRDHYRRRIKRAERDQLLRDELWECIEMGEDEEEAVYRLHELYMRNPNWDGSRLMLMGMEAMLTTSSSSLPKKKGWIRSRRAIEMRMIVATRRPLWLVMNHVFGSMIFSPMGRERFYDAIRHICPLTSFPMVERRDLMYDGSDPDFAPSSAALMVDPMNPAWYVVNVRKVNYRITESGGYVTMKNGQIVPYFQCMTKNEYYFMDRATMEPVSPIRPMENDIPARRMEETTIMGIEDVRIYCEEEKEDVMFYGVTREYSYMDAIRIIQGRYDMERGRLCDAQPLHPPYDENGCEKNWVACGGGQFIYRWCPIEIGRIDKMNRLVIEHRIPTAPLFNEFRGSSPGVVWKDFTWFSVHAVIHIDGKRKYVHLLVILDLATHTLVAVSSPFVFEALQIEYSIGLDVSERGVVMTYSVHDMTSRILRVPLLSILNILHYCDEREKRRFMERIFL